MRVLKYILILLGLCAIASAIGVLSVPDDIVSSWLHFGDYPIIVQKIWLAMLLGFLNFVFFFIAIFLHIREWKALISTNVTDNCVHTVMQPMNNAPLSNYVEDLSNLYKPKYNEVVGGDNQSNKNNKSNKNKC